MPEEKPFDSAVQDFLAYEKTVPGQLRYTLARENFLPYLPTVESASERLPRILDACGGSGPDSAWLAVQGYGVCLIEPSTEQLNFARQRFEDLTDDTRDKIEVIQDEIAELDDSYHDFDGALSHVVASYLEDPSEYFAQVIRRVKKGGILSVLENGEAGAWQVLKSRGNNEEIEKFKETRRYINHIHLEARAFTFNELESLLRAIGMKVLDRAGIRIESNYIRSTVADYGQNRFEELLAKERSLSKDPVRMHDASLLQIIAQKI